MSLTKLTALSPLDGRYAEEVEELAPIFSEYGFIKLRLFVEVKWLKTLALEPKITEIAKFSIDTIRFLDSIVENFSEQDAERVKDIEKQIKHDTKAIEYFLKEKISTNAELNAAKEFIHFACTSDDTGNLAYGLMLKMARNQHFLPHMEKVVDQLRSLAHDYARQPMLAHTHGQPASPTTVGKEFANFTARLERIYQNLLHIPIMGKFNGVVGNFNVHSFVYPEIDWRELAQNFVAELGFHYNEYTTQIEPHDGIVEFCNSVTHFNSILLDLVRDLWGYIALGYFKQKVSAIEVGSSVMPHKVNPIDFENAEGNLGLANAILRHLSEKLPISRWQRDLSDSTVLRNLGIGFGYSLLAYKMVQKGLGKLTVDGDALAADLEEHWEILAEAVQTMMRRYGILEPYEKLKALTRGKKITREMLHAFIAGLDLPVKAKDDLLRLTPSDYLGKAVELANEV